ncbi:MAG: 30S ribosomal protein S20 [Bryobacteraceae bacterium]|nr:30S ribosomal protein S20 [Bryobacteraceae bacterium]
MANHVSSIKRTRGTERKTNVNRLRKSRMRTQIKKLRKLLLARDVNGLQQELPATYSIVDRAAKWGIIKKNTAARYKSRLTARVVAISAAPAA